MDDNNNKSLEDNDDSDEDGSGPPSDEEENMVNMPLSKACACITSTKHEFDGGTSNVSAQWALIGELDTYREGGTTAHQTFTGNTQQALPADTSIRWLVCQPKGQCETTQCPRALGI